MILLKLLSSHPRFNNLTSKPSFQDSICGLNSYGYEKNLSKSKKLKN